MLKKLVNGEYSLKHVFWLFGCLGFFVFFLITNITHNGILRLACHYDGVCPKNIIIYTLSNFINMFISKVHSNMAPYLASHLLLSTVFVVYMYLVLRGLWKSAKNHEGSAFWCWAAKVFLVCMALYCLKSVI